MSSSCALLGTTGLHRRHLGSFAFVRRDGGICVLPVFSVMTSRSTGRCHTGTLTGMGVPRQDWHLGIRTPVPSTPTLFPSLAVPLFSISTLVSRALYSGIYVAVR